MAATPSQDRVVSALEGRVCKHCERGELVRGQHKGAAAVVCRDCGVPQVRFG